VSTNSSLNFTKTDVLTQISQASFIEKKKPEHKNNKKPQSNP